MIVSSPYSSTLLAASCSACTSLKPSVSYMDWTKIEAYAGPLYYNQLELLQMFGFSPAYASKLFCYVKEIDGED